MKRLENAVPDSSNGERLDSWKEIASYLGREVRTVQRWEKREGLPVHRHQHDKLGTVYAYKGELEEWLNRRKPTIPQQPARFNTRTIAIAVSIFLLIGLIAAAYVIGRKSATTDTPAVKKRLLVLPFKNLTPDSEQEWFSDGLTEEMIAQLAALRPESLAVIGRASSAYFKSSEKSIAQIGEELNVDFVLEGSVRREGERVRVTAQLIDARDESHLWAESYDRDLPGALTFQEEVSRRIARSLGNRLLDGKSASRVVSHNPVAVEAYLRGRYQWNRGTREGFEKSIESFQEAARADDRFALAYAGLAQAWMMTGRYGIRPPAQCFSLAKDAAEKAIALDARLAEARAVLAQVKFYWEWDFKASEEEFLRAIEINPGLASAHHAYAHFLSEMSRHDEAIAEVKRAQEMEPLSATINSDAGWFYYRARRYEEAIRECRRVMEMEPQFSSSAICIVQALEKMGRFEEARQEAKKFFASAGMDKRAAALGATDPRVALRDLRRVELEELKRMSRNQTVMPFQFAFVYALLEEKDSTIEWLEKSVTARDHVALLMGAHPAFDCVRDDPRFTDLLRRMGMRAS
ncbi:MAG: tetratricopeptide repeat protein [Acidobacteriota bacterium]